MSSRDRDREPRESPTASHGVEPIPTRGRAQAWRSAARSTPGAELALTLLGARIRALRLKLSLSQQAAAARAQLDPKHWQVIEHGGTNPTVASLVAISRALKVELGDLF